MQMGKGKNARSTPESVQGQSRAAMGQCQTVPPPTPATHETSVIQKEGKTAEGVNLKSKTHETIITGHVRLVVATYCHWNGTELPGSEPK